MQDIAWLQSLKLLPTNQREELFIQHLTLKSMEQPMAFSRVLKASDISGKTVLMGLSGLMNHTQVIHELLCHPDIDILARDREGRTAEQLACPHVKNILHAFR